MALIAAFDEISPDHIRKNPGGPDRPAATIYEFFRARAQTPEAPSAFLAQYDPGENSAAHFHEVDQYQILVKGKGSFGRHAVEPYYVHFSRAYTPYGPLTADKEGGWTFMTLRTRYDPGAQRLPGALPKLKQIANRNPWQATVPARFPPRGAGVKMADMPELRDDQGLFVKTVTMAPGARATAPSASGGDGQYVVAVRGSMMHEAIERRALSVVFIEPQEPAFEIVAGPQGLEALILNFPRRGSQTPVHAPPTATGFKKWQCVLCAFFYDEEKGLPEEGIAPGTRWADVPDTWNCPDCAASKADFEMMEV
jgi:rubredoxin